MKQKFLWTNQVLYLLKFFQKSEPLVWAEPASDKNKDNVFRLFAIFCSKWLQKTGKFAEFAVSFVKPGTIWEMMK